MAHGGHLHTGAHVDALLAEHPGQQLARLRLLRAEEPLPQLQQRHRGAEAGEGLRQLGADRSATDDHEARGRLGDVHDLPVGPVRRARQPVDRRRRGGRAGVEDHSASGLELHHAVVGRDAHSPGPVQAAVTAHQPHARLLERACVRDVVPVVVGLADPRGRRPQVGAHRHLAREPVGRSSLGERIGGADQQLGGRAAPERALAAHEARLDADHAQPGLGQLARGMLTAGAQPEDHHVDLLRRTHGDTFAEAW
ncbi:unannotated protein [freshwater metagenome]|uniref:Unannotated protein n=1 Tax=freshwater metagenome TaxID=449393 RepID=A0A6J6R8Q0_9ZZZZ